MLLGNLLKHLMLFCSAEDCLQSLRRTPYVDFFPLIFSPICFKKNTDCYQTGCDTIKCRKVCDSRLKLCMHKDRSIHVHDFWQIYKAVHTNASFSITVEQARFPLAYLAKNGYNRNHWFAY